ncbi:hypothetical protein H634G_07522 [Metarhizium anisopliae BRIP 53293]|uniref:Uncharacterized protein n=1 Tax=Metarhizium anisopliae BRIP 53293 TaxID=1291518 RepID=A0A0D9NX85_METAN|nr:hypothetical protein H634G_07522 [Metarhizium anisopliae BRIP 53293]KJK96115.1 hypothetical protein H633G_00055 [Metarhizium anisopliae BRIP 53284]
MVLNVNQRGFQRRLAVVEQILQSHDLRALNISTLAYSEEYLCPFNNYLFKVELATPALSSSFSGTQLGTTQAPSNGISVIVIKFCNPAATIPTFILAVHILRIFLESLSLESQPLCPRTGFSQSFQQLRIRISLYIP